MAVWATKIIGDNSEEGTSVNVDANDNILVTGYYGSNQVLFYNVDGTIGKTLTKTNNINLDIDVFLVKYNKFGQILWATKAGSTGMDVGYSVTTDSVGNIIITGFYSNTNLNIYNNNCDIAASLPSSGNIDAYVIKYTDYGQELCLGCPQCPSKLKTIILNCYNNIRTLIKIPKGSVIDESGKEISGILFAGKGATISLNWYCTRWNIVYNQGVILL